MSHDKLRPNTDKFSSMDEFVRLADSGGMHHVKAEGEVVTPVVQEKPAPFNLQMPPVLRKRIKILSAQTGIHMNDLIITALMEKYPE